ncbi:MAG: hypothetical protein ACRDOE_17455 [Streptosporangiaceae bacterium]
MRDTLALCDQAASVVSGIAHAQGIRSKQALQRKTCGTLKGTGLSAQPAIHVARKVAGAYATLKANIRAGNYGPEGSRRRVKTEANRSRSGRTRRSRSMTGACPGSPARRRYRSGLPAGA